jgi:hypothetical protein
LVGFEEDDEDGDLHSKECDGDKADDESDVD